MIRRRTLDATSKKRAEEDFRSSEARYRDLVENANDLIFTVDREGYCLSMNRAGRDVMGHVASDRRGTNLRQLVAPEQVEMALQLLERVFEGRDVRTLELDLVSRSGKRLSLEVSIRPMLKHGVVIAAHGIARDITERRELEQRLRQAEKMDAVGRLAAGVAQDFNSLLTVILGHCELGANPAATRESFAVTLADIRSAAERAASLTEQLLAFSRQQVIRPQVCDPNIVIAEVRRMMARLIGEDVEIQFRPASNVGFVNADPSQLQQVVMNLAVNARDAMPDGGRLAIATRHVHFARPHVESGARIAPGDYVLLSVADTGLGMDDRTRAQIFEPFFTTKEVGKGTGLGLATVYGIVKQNGGFIFVDSARGLGTTFKIYLPQVAPPQPRVEEMVHVEDAGAGHETVVVVEDEPEVRGLLTDYLQTRGYTVLSAENGEQALALCRSLPTPPALLITDIVMPGMSGRALAEQLRGRWRQMKVLYVSGYSDDAQLRRGVLPNGTHLLQKPFTLSLLAGKVRDIIDGTAAASR